VHSYAQTNIQLFNQLQRLGWNAADIEAVVSAYELAASLVTGRFRPSGKTFVAHLIGTASILASVPAAPSLVVAGLLHAAYSAGDFGDGAPGMSDAKRERVRSVAGTEAEEHVRRYQALAWTDQTIRSVSGGLDAMTQAERGVVLMRLANELEEFLDRGVLYCGDRKRRAISDPHRCRLLIEVAQRLGYQNLSDELAKRIAEASSSLPAELLPARTNNSSYLVAPASYQRLMDSVTARLAGVSPQAVRKPGE
jgi:(p)ppGpp synthase/HD superfamily hydrolase